MHMSPNAINPKNPGLLIADDNTIPRPKKVIPIEKTPYN